MKSFRYFEVKRSGVRFVELDYQVVYPMWTASFILMYDPVKCNICKIGV